MRAEGLDAWASNVVAWQFKGSCIASNPSSLAPMNASGPKTSPAARLSGLTLDDGWTVTKLLVPIAGHTGGNFSIPYEVVDASNRRAFLKAIDLSRAFQAQDPMEALRSLTNWYVFERELVRVCKSRRMSRVVQVLADGKVVLDKSDPFSVVQYLIFELADGDVRDSITRLGSIDEAWALRVLHHTALGLYQLHSADIAHQDLKPSNLLVFGEDNCTKVADLGRACVRDGSSPFEILPKPGDPNYAPPEQLYGYKDPDWGKRRIGCDVYQLGSMIMFLFGNASAAGMLMGELPPQYHWRSWRGTFEEVLPYLQHAFGRVLQVFRSGLPVHLQPQLFGLVRELCNPDPNVRGSARRRWAYGTALALEEYVSRLNLLAEAAEYRARRGSIK